MQHFNQTINNLWANLPKERLSLQQTMRLAIASPSQQLQQILDYIFQDNGKQLRALLAISIAKTARVKAEAKGKAGSAIEDGKAGTFMEDGKAVPTTDAVTAFAAAIELVHTATLVHDDIIDTAETRRNQTTANQLWGNSQTVLAGDFLYAKAIALLLKLENTAAMQAVMQASVAMVEGEFLQAQVPKLWELGDLANLSAADLQQHMATYEQIIYYKTASLFAATCEGIASCLQLSEPMVKLWFEFGKTLGLAYQMLDDVQDYCQLPLNTVKLGKGDDLKNGRLTLPILYCLQCQDKTVSHQLNALLVNSKSASVLNSKSATGYELASIVELLTKQKVFAACLEQIKQKLQYGSEILNKLKYHSLHDDNLHDHSLHELKNRDSNPDADNLVLAFDLIANLLQSLQLLMRADGF